MTMPRKSDREVHAAVTSDAFEAALSANLRALEARQSTGKGGEKPGVVCLGESHGSHFLNLDAATLPGTGGLLIQLPGSQGGDILVDPGWGTLAAARRLGVDLTSVGVILVSHCHLDHVGDLPAVLLQLHLNGRRPTLVANETTLCGGPLQPPVLSQFFLDLCTPMVRGVPSEQFAVGDVTVHVLPTAHRENREVAGKAICFVITLPMQPARRLAVITDGPIDEGHETILAAIRSCDFLVVNIGTLSGLPASPVHDRVFDNALCLSGLTRLLRSLATGEHHIREIGVTHLGAELLGTFSSAMEAILSELGCRSPVEALAGAVAHVAHESLGPKTVARPLREGDVMELTA